MIDQTSIGSGTNGTASLALGVEASALRRTNDAIEIRKNVT
jgi:hypothetical protein